MIRVRGKKFNFGSYQTAEDHSLVMHTVQQVLDKYEKNINMYVEVSEARYEVSIALPNSKYAQAFHGD